MDRSAHVGSEGIAALEAIAAAGHHLAVVSTTRPDGSVQSSVVNAGILAHPTSRDLVVGFVTYGRAKLANLRRLPRATLVFRDGWRWIAVEGRCELAGPDDPLPGLGPGALAPLLRDVFRAAGGTHDDWDAYDQVMAAQRRTAVLVRPERVYSNPRAAS